MKKNVEPRPGSLRAQIRPPCAWTIPLAIVEPQPQAPARRRPVPLPVAVEDVGSCSADMPAPESATANVTSRASWLTVTSIRPSGGVC